MSFRYVLRVVSVLLLLVSSFMGFAIAVALLAGEAALVPAFLIPIAMSLLFALLMTAISPRSDERPLPIRASYLLVALSWLLASANGALPFVISGAIPSYVDAFFETMSGFTTTGASILTNIEAVPRCLLFWRSMTHWLGGMGIVVLTVALFPLLGIGGLRLMDAEAPGPTVDKITPRVSSTAKILWLLYLGLTLVEILLLLLGGMNLFDAATHTFGTVATGGFSPRNASVGAYRSAYIDVVITVFMILAGTNFNLYYRLLRGELRSVARDSELRVYLAVFVVSTAIVSWSLYRGAAQPGLGSALRFAGFQTASILTTTGFVTADYARWPHLAQVVLFILMFIGGSAGSTGGGIKVVRLVTLFKQAAAELKYMVSPRGVFAVHMGGQPVRKNVIYSVYSFVLLYLAILFSAIFVVATGGYDIITSTTAALATLGNIGPGFGLVGPTGNYAHFPPYIKVYLSVVMMTGRLEVYTVLLLFAPSFWKR